LTAPGGADRIEAKQFEKGMRMYAEMMQYMRENENALMSDIQAALRARGFSDAFISMGFRDYAMGV